MATNVAHLTVTVPHRRMKAAIWVCYILSPITNERMQGRITGWLSAWVGRGLTVRAIDAVS